jgi:transcriptional regulator with XRE-family HTH domain
MNNLRDKELLREFGKQVRKLRLERSFTQKELAFKMDVEISQISRIERGLINPTLSTIVHLAKCLNTSVCSFFGEVIK